MLLVEASQRPPLRVAANPNVPDLTESEPPMVHGHFSALTGTVGYGTEPTATRRHA